MTDIISSVSTAISLAKQLRDANEKIKNVEFRVLLADLALELAQLKEQLSNQIVENSNLRARIVQLEAAGKDPCPKCHMPTWALQKSVKDPVFGDLGGVRRTYICSDC